MKAEVVVRCSSSQFGGVGDQAKLELAPQPLPQVVPAMARRNQEQALEDQGGDKGKG